MSVNSYLLNFRRGWFFEKVRDLAPVRYQNAMTESTSADFNTPGPNNNIIEMRWVVQRELAGSNVYFHEVTIPPGTVEGTHQHIGSEELYYIFEGEGIAYMGDGDDPNLRRTCLCEHLENIHGDHPQYGILKNRFNDRASRK